MAPRANWKGYLKLSLVSCAVALYPATSTNARVRFNIINKKTGNRIHNEVVDAETGDEVPAEDRVKGYKSDSGRYVLLEDEELDRVALESTHTIDIESFIPRAEVDELYFDAPYFIAPNDKVGVEAFGVIRAAMEKRNVVGLARVVLYRRERLVMLEPRGAGLLATTLRYANEVREADSYFEDIPEVKVAPDMLELATHILDSKKAHFDPAKFEDRYEEGLVELIKAKKNGKALPEAPEPPPSNVVNLMDALRRSVQEEGGGGRKPAKSSATTRRTTSRRAPAKGGASKRRMKKAG
jgi:DNA end-binding protein Ku